MDPAFTPHQQNATSVEEPASGAGFTIETSKIVGTPADGFWSQVHTFFPQDREKKEKRGDLLAVLVVSGVEEGIGAVAFGREILGRLHEEYYGDLTGSAFEKLGEAVGKVGRENEGLEIVAASLSGRVLYLAIYGQGRVVLKRGDKLGIVLQGDPSAGRSTLRDEPLGSDSKSSVQVQKGSGILEEGDWVLLGSDHLFQAVGIGVLKVALESNSPEEAVENLAPIVLGHNNMADAAAILALVKKELPVVGSVSRLVEKEEEIKVEDKRANLLERIFSKIKLPQRKSFFVRRTNLEKRKKVLFIVALTLLVLLAVALGFGLKQRAADKRQNKVKSLISLAEEKFNQSKEVYSANPGEGKTFLAEAEKLIGEGLVLEKNSQELTLLKEQIEKFSSSLGVETALQEVPVFMDLSLITDGASGVSLSLLDKDLAILDANKEKVYLLDTEKKSNVVYELKQSGGKLMTAFAGKIVVFTEKGIAEVDTKNKSVSIKINKDEEWKEVVGLASFNGNLYLLDKGASDIWRYLASGEGYGTRKSWFVGSPPDFSGAISMTIDGAVWVLEKDKISKFNLSQPESFSLTKMPESFDNPTKIYTSIDDQNLYVLDKGRGKIYEITKSGEFRAAYSWEGIKEASDLVAVESVKKIFLLSGTKIYEIGMK